jgi:CMD domain protein
MTDPDVIDQLAGLEPNSPLATIRDRKPVTRQQAHASYLSLFEPAEPGDVMLQERFAIAVFVTGLHAPEQDAPYLLAENTMTAFYAAGLSRTAPTEPFLAALSAEILLGRTAGPYGAYPAGPLSVEDVTGPSYDVAEPHRAALGTRVTAALVHAHRLVFHPRDADAAALQALLDAGWSTTGIVTLSQLVAFLAFQIRAVAGLRTLAAARPRGTSHDRHRHHAPQQPRAGGIYPGDARLAALAAAPRRGRTDRSSA